MKKNNLLFWILKNKTKIISYFVLAVFFVGYSTCKQSTEMFSKGQSFMNGNLTPELLPIVCGVKEIKSLPEQNKFLLINGRNEFAVATLSENEKVETDVILHDYPNSVADGAEFTGLYSDDAGNVIWTIQTRAILAMDRLTKKTFDPLFAFGGNTSLAQTIMIDDKNQIIAGRVLDLTGDNGNSKKYLISYDCEKGQLGEPGKPYKGFLFWLGDGRYLWCETLGALDKVQWHVCDKNLENLQHNKLTKELTDKQISMFGNTTPVSDVKRMMVGVKEFNDTSHYFSVRWNSDMSEVKIEPLLVQVPQNGGFEEWWFFSEDGNWLITTFWTLQPEEKQTLVFFHIDDKYPQGISLPVFGQETLYEKKGCFVNHSVHGPLYLDWSPEFANTLLVYRLNDVFKVLAEKAGVSR